MDAPLRNILNLPSISIIPPLRDPEHLSSISTYKDADDEDCLACARGTRTAFTLEISACILAYGVWIVCHLKG